jgi:prepilin-type N-terminal cleavage/methylation domain-containing protein
MGENISLNTENGFSLVEIMIAVAIFSLGLAVLASMQIIAITANSTSNIRTQMATVAQEKMEELLALPYNHADLSDNKAPKGEKTTHDDSAPPEGYTIQWSVDENSPREQMKTINVTVSRAVAGKGEKTFTLSFARSGIGN